MYGGVRRSFIGLPCHGGDSVGMTKVHCSFEGYLDPRGIHLRNEELVDDYGVPR